MSVDLPATGNQSARQLAASQVSYNQLARAITYLELVRCKQIDPGPEIEQLFGPNTLLTWDIFELNAVQNRLAFAICIRGRLEIKITAVIRESVFRNREEVLRSYREHGRNYGRITKSRDYGTRSNIR
jgi:hypothetical protein